MYLSIFLAKAIGQYVVVKEQEVRERVEESEQIYTFELPIETFYNEHTDEIVKVKKYAYDRVISISTVQIQNESLRLS